MKLTPKISPLLCYIHNFNACLTSHNAKHNSIFAHINFTMAITFYKYQGTGNDFIIIDNRQLVFPKNNTKLIADLCDRKFGIGADGLILLENDDSADFKMIYFNSDGNQSTMCGNGGRCIVAFAKKLGIIQSKTRFTAIDGIHDATIDFKDNVALKMQDVTEVKTMSPTEVFLDTGSPHHIVVCKSLNDLDVVKQGANIRYNVYGEAGCNVNFVAQQSENVFKVRTYERGVENETLSCGTGVTAVAIAMHHLNYTDKNKVVLTTLGGDLSVSFVANNKQYKEVFLTGPATFVFKGEVSW